MKIYNYSRDTAEYLGTTDADLDPLESQVQGHDVFLIPAKATTVPPPELQEGNARVFNGTNWDQVEDHRGSTVYGVVDAKQHVLLALGPIPAGMTLLPPCPYPVWDGEKWIADSAAQAAEETEKLIQEKIREQAIAALQTEGKLDASGVMVAQKRQITP